MCGVPYHAVAAATSHEAARPPASRSRSASRCEDPARGQGARRRATWCASSRPGTVLEEESLDPGAAQPTSPRWRATAASAVRGRRGRLRRPARCASRSSTAGPRRARGARRGWRRASCWSRRRELAADGARTAMRTAAALGAGGALPEPRRAVDGAAGAAARRVRPAGALARTSTRLPRAAGAPARRRSAYALRRRCSRSTRRRGATSSCFETLRGERRGSLLWVLDETRTPMGRRLLREWLLAPLPDVARDRRPARRGRGAGATASRRAPRCATRSAASATSSAWSAASGARAAGRRATWSAWRRRWRAVAAVRAALADARRRRCSRGWRRRSSRCRRCAAGSRDARRRAAAAHAARPAASAPGCHAEVDELRALAQRRQGLDRASSRRASGSRTGIASLKVRYNQVFGYYIEVTKANLPPGAAGLRRKQTLAGAERFVTPELKEHEAKRARAPRSGCARSRSSCFDGAAGRRGGAARRRWRAPPRRWRASTSSPRWREVAAAPRLRGRGSRREPRARHPRRPPPGGRGDGRARAASSPTTAASTPTSGRS